MSANKRKYCTPPVEITPRIIGFEKIYPQQSRSAQRALAVLLDNERSNALNRRSPIILMEPQCGKTGAIIALIFDFIKDCVVRSRTFQVVVFCGLSRLDLAQQTRERLTEAIDGAVRSGARLHVVAMNSGLSLFPNQYQREGILITHNTTKLQALDLHAPVDVRLWVGDEVHLGNVKNGMVDTMLRNHGVRLCEQIHAWDRGRTVNHFVGVSATPSAHLIKSDLVQLDGTALFHPIYEPPPSSYNGIDTMLENERMRQTATPFSSDGVETAFLTRVMQDFLEACRKQTPGYLVARATGRMHARFMAWLRRNGARTECREFDAEKKNLDELNRCLSIRPAEPTVVLIRGSMRAGITVGQNHFIRGWIETGSATSDSQVQAGVGRACGYGRSNDTYPIYCDLQHVRNWSKAYRELRCSNGSISIPSGIKNKPLSLNKDHGYVPTALTYGEAQQQWVTPISSEAARYHIAKVSTNVREDIARMFLHGRRISPSVVGVYIDGPTTKEAVKEYLKLGSSNGNGRRKVDPDVAWGWWKRNQKSYEELIKRFPEALGTVFRHVSNNSETIQLGPSRDDLQKKGSALKED